MCSPTAQLAEKSFSFSALRPNACQSATGIEKSPCPRFTALDLMQLPCGAIKKKFVPYRQQSP
jgi:hypothetical protein